jgi:hypothetical protein
MTRQHTKLHPTIRSLVKLYEFIIRRRQANRGGASHCDEVKLYLGVNSSANLIEGQKVAYEYRSDLDL